MGMGNRDTESMLGDPRKAILRMILPFLLSLIAVQANVFADTFWVSGLGMNAVSGMTTGLPMYILFTGIGIGISVGATATMAYRIGSGDLEGAGKLAGCALAIGAGLAAASSVAVFFLMDPLTDFMGADDVREEIRAYLTPMLLLSPPIILNSVFGGMLRGEGSASRSTAVQISGAALNMVLDPLLMYGAGMGLSGASLATGLSSMFGVALAVHWYVSGKTAVHVGRGSLRPSLAVAKELLAVAGPRTAEGIINNITILVQRIFIIMAGGTAGVALFNVPFKYVSLMQTPAEATGMSMVPVTAASFGGKDAGKMSESVRYSMRIAMAFSISLAAVLFLFAEPLMSVFMTDGSMLEWKDEFAWNARMYAIILPLYSLQTMGSSVLQAIKRSVRPMEIALIITGVRTVLFGIASAYDYRAITYALICSYVVSASLTQFFARRELRKAVQGLGSRRDG